MINTQRTLRRVGLLAGTSLLAMAAIGPAASPALAKPSGSIWTTDEDCSAQGAQNANSYDVGETVFLRGANFAPSSAFTWSVSGKPGGASGDPNQEVGAGGSTTDAAGALCVAAYVVAADDWGEYSVKVEQGSTRKNDNFSVDPGDEVSPPAEDPGDEPGDEATDPGDEVSPPTDDPVDDPSDDPGDEATDPGPEATPAVDDETPASNEGSGDEADDSATPPEQAVEPAAETGDPGETETTDPADDSSASGEDAGDGGSDGAPNQDLLDTAGGPSVTPPPTDTMVAPSDQASATDWRIIIAFLGFLVLAATFGLPDRRRAA